MGIKLLVIAIFSVWIALAGQANAREQCYTPEQLHAEQLLRLHSELMVTTVTCRQSSIGEDLVPKYTGFTKAHIHDLHEAEQTLENYYKHSSGGDGITRLDKLRTQLANEYGQRIANASAPAYCTQHRDVVVQMYEARPEQVDLEVERMVAEEKSYGHLCGGDTRIAKHGQ